MIQFIYPQFTTAYRALDSPAPSRSKSLKCIKSLQWFSPQCATLTHQRSCDTYDSITCKRKARGPVREKVQTDLGKVDHFYFTKNTSPLPFHLQLLELSLSDSCPPTVQAALPSLPEHSCQMQTCSVTHPSKHLLDVQSIYFCICI